MFVRAKKWGAFVAIAVGMLLPVALPAWVLLLPAPATAAPAVIQLKMLLGEQKIVSSDGVNSFSEGVKGIVDIRLTKNSDNFVIVALRPGVTTLLFIMMDGSERQYRIEVKDPDAKNAAQKGPQKVNPFEVTAKDNVRLDLYFIQLDEGYNHQLGFNWPSAFPSDASVNLNMDLQTGTLNAGGIEASQILPRLDLAQQTGWARLMRHATVITANGTQAEFNSGGEVNIAVQSAMNTGVFPIRFGSRISVLPTYDSESGRIEMQVTADVSDLTDDRGTGTPGRTTSRVTSVANLELGQSIMIGGLVAQSTIRSITGLPALSQIPFLGALFGTRNALDQNTENVLFIIPSVVDSVALDARGKIQEALAAYEAYDGDLESATLPSPKMPPKQRLQSAGSKQSAAERKGKK